MDVLADVERHYPEILRSAILLTGDRVEAEDLAQETFLRALGTWNRFRGKSSRRTWLYSILLNVHRSHLRGRRRRWERVLHWFHWTQESKPDLPENGLLRQEWKNSLWHAVGRLPLPQQHAVVLRYSNALSYAEIAVVMNCPIGTVKSRINAALKKLGEDRSVRALELLAIED